jgi:hypothetical protein
VIAISLPNASTFSSFSEQALAKCDFLLKSASAVSEFAVYFSPQLHNNSFDFQIEGQPTPPWFDGEVRATPLNQK